MQYNEVSTIEKWSDSSINASCNFVILSTNPLNTISDLLEVKRKLVRMLAIGGDFNVFYAIFGEFWTISWSCVESGALKPDFLKSPFF